MPKRQNLTNEHRSRLHRKLNEGDVDGLFRELHNTILGHSAFGTLIRKNLQIRRYKNVVFDGCKMRELFDEFGGIEGWRGRHKKSECNKKVRLPAPVTALGATGRARCPTCRQTGPVNVSGIFVDGGECSVCLEKDQKMALFIGCLHAKVCVTCTQSLITYVRS